MIIKNIYMIDPASDTEGIRDIYIKDGRIADITDPSETGQQAADHDPGYGEVIDGTGLTAVPGLVDTHVHFRDPGFTYKEDIETGACAAAAGGFTSVVMMANTSPAIDNPDTLKYVLDKGAATDINVYSCADISIGLKGEQLTDMAELHALGAIGFTDDGKPLKDAALVKRAMEQAAELGVPLSFHEEDPKYISENGINADAAAEYYGIKGSPRMAEISLIGRDIELASGTSADIVIQHISSAEGVDLVRKARQTNKHIHAEVTPHHFTLTEKAVIEQGTMAKMNPPLRTETDRQALIAGLKDGTIEIIATDHAPHCAEEKRKPLTEAPSGIIGLETSLGLGIRELVDTGALSMMELIRRMSTNPAMLYGIDAGRLCIGGPADITLFDREAKWTVPETFASKSCNSPFKGQVLPGRIFMTICRGCAVYRADSV